jgi:hypothetical protein
MPPPSPDPLAALARLRRFELAAARRRLADRLAGLAAAEARCAAAAAALAAEAAAGDGAAYAAWLPRGRAERDRAAGALRVAEDRMAAAQAELGAARAAAHLVESLQERRAALARRQAVRDAQSALDDAVSIRAVRRT